MSPAAKVHYVYGPVPSRRLGFSLGIDIIPHKICSFDCVYCQLGRSTQLTLERRPYIPIDKIIPQVKNALTGGKKIDFLTFSGSGEPTLNSRIGDMIREIKSFTKIPVAVITNGSLLYRTDVQLDLLKADVILPTLCAASERTMRKINRFHKGISARRIISGLKDFRKKYRGAIWLEVMLIKKINDTPGELKRLILAIRSIKPEKVQLNTVVRPPCDRSVRPLTHGELEKVKDYLGGECEIIADFQQSQIERASNDSQEKILEMIRRRPVTAADISRSLGLSVAEVDKTLTALRKKFPIKISRHAGEEYYGF